LAAEATEEINAAEDFFDDRSARRGAPRAAEEALRARLEEAMGRRAFMRRDSEGGSLHPL